MFRSRCQIGSTPSWCCRDGWTGTKIPEDPVESALLPYTSRSCPLKSTMPSMRSSPVPTPVVKKGAPKKDKSRCKVLVYRLRHQCQSTPLSVTSTPTEPSMGSPKKKLNVAICIALGVKPERATTGAWVRVIGHVTDASTPKLTATSTSERPSPAAPRTTVPGSMVKVSPN